MKGSGVREKIMYELKDYLNDINHEKKNLMDSEDELWEKKYPAYVINRCLSAFTDTIFYVNEMNRMHFLDNKLQNDFLINSLRKRKRFAKWLRPDEVKNIEYVKKYYGYSNEKAKQALEVLTDEQIEIIVDLLTDKKTHQEIRQIMKLTKSKMDNRLSKISLLMYDDNKSFDDIIKVTKLPESKIKHLIDTRKAKEK